MLGVAGTLSLPLQRKQIIDIDKQISSLCKHASLAREYSSDVVNVNAATGKTLDLNPTADVTL